MAKKTGQNQEDYIDLAIYGVIFGIIGARVYYVVFSWDMYKNDLLSIFISGKVDWQSMVG